MISANVLSSLEWLFEKSIRGNSIQGPEDTCVVTFQSGASSPTETARHRLVVLNISSYIFRIVTLFDLDTDAATVSHLAKIMRRGNEILVDKSLLDAFGEFANIICGEVNRELSMKFRHIGMSTPFFLEYSCLPYVSILKPLHVCSAEVNINDSVHFRVVICICVDNEANLDFDIDRTEQPTVSTGSLELF
ncbi:conserved hypothetical protein [Gammaproteobacteria bacterium]